MLPKWVAGNLIMWSQYADVVFASMRDTHTESVSLETADFSRGLLFFHTDVGWLLIPLKYRFSLRYIKRRMVSEGRQVSLVMRCSSLALFAPVALQFCTAWSLFRVWVG